MVEFENQVIPILCRMSNIEKLTLAVRVKNQTSFLDGIYLNNVIISHLTHLHTFIIDFVTEDVRLHPQVMPSPDDIRRTFIQNNHNVDCYIEYHSALQGRCHVYSLPFVMERIHTITHSFPGGMFMNVRLLNIFDFEHSFEHAFFVQISRSFPSLNHLTLSITKKQTVKVSQQLRQRKDLFSIAEYSCLTELNFSRVHVDYVKQFLSYLNTHLPSLLKLHIDHKHLVTVTKNFTKRTTRKNCAKVKSIIFDYQMDPVHSKDFFLYFPSL